MQNEITSPTKLLTTKGKLAKEGWARHPYFNYVRKEVKANKFRIKEWDYYAITNQQEGYTITVTVSDLGYSTLVSIAYIDYQLKKYSSVDKVVLLPFKRINLHNNSTDNSYISKSYNNIRACFVKSGNIRKLMFSSPQLVLPNGQIGLDVNVELIQEEDMESINIATSWEKNRKAFYLNEKINCMKVNGIIKRGYEVEEIEPNTTFATLDWGRGRWTYNNTWYWASLSTLIDDIPVGFNLGYGFSDRTPASEDAIFYNNKIHKLDRVEFIIPESYLEKPWNFKDNEGRLDLTFNPLIDRHGYFNYGIIKSDQHQVFGEFSGKLILDNKDIILLDKHLGFAEKVANKW
ncbi:MAG: DUF2804 domain-containing protein [Sphaerochaetaceae bacterium]|nr:DUF2804 domain-containing protein [Sphaerochaetaceae bacterium]